MIHELSSILVAVNDPDSAFVEITLSADQQVEVLKVKLNEAIRHINVLEEKLLSPEDLKEPGALGVDVTGTAIGKGPQGFAK